MVGIGDRPKEACLFLLRIAGRVVLMAREETLVGILPRREVGEEKLILHLES